MFRSIIITSMWANLLFCQQGWVSLQGPEGGAMPYILCLPPEYQNVIGTTTGTEVNGIWGAGIYFSKNFCERWHLREKGIDWSKGAVHQIDYDCTNPNIIYIAQGGGSTGERGGIYKTTDAGLTWFNISPADTCFRAIYCSRKSPNILLAGANPGIYRSTDGGNTWVKVHSSAICSEFVYDPKCPDTVYGPSLSYYGYIYRSTDGGSTWAEVGTSLPPMTNKFSMAVDPESSVILYVICDYLPSISGVYRSSDFGNTWSYVLPVPDGLSKFYKIRCSPLDPNIVWVVGFVYSGKGVYLSTDRGLTFQQISNFWGRAGYGVYPLPNNPRGAIVSGYGGMSITTDLGETWQRRNYRLHANSVHSLQIVSQDLIYASTYGARHWGTIQKTTDGGKTWNLILEGNDIYRVEVDPTNSNIVICYYGGHVKSTDGGANWYSYLPVLNCVKFSKANTSYVWGANRSNQPGYPRGIYKSTDKGDSWTRVLIPGDTLLEWAAVASHPQDTNIILAIGSTVFTTKIYRTTNGGSSWAMVYQNNNPHYLFDVVFSISNPNIAYACGDDIVLKSTDEGLNWNEKPVPNDGVYNRLSINPTNSEQVILANEKGIFYTSDGGNSWKNVSYNLEGGYDIFWFKQESNDYWYVGNARGVHIFGIIDTLRPSVTVTQPNGGEVLWSGQNYNILWNATDNIEVDGIDIFYSTDAGTLYQGISYNELNDGIYSWTVPNTPSNQCLVRIDAYDFAGNIAWDRSDNYFSIQQTNIEENKPRAEGDVSLEIRGLGKPIIYCTTKENTDADFA
ncbi:MAG: hypothetical protein ABIL02_07275, partial [candidate division WOR-3 bacterium]